MKELNEFISRCHSEKKQTIIFLHGLPLKAKIYDSIISSLQEYRCIVVDLIGFLTENHHQDISEVAVVLAENLKKLNVSSGILASTGIGTDVALQLGLILPDVVEAEIFFSEPMSKSNQEIVELQLQLLRLMNGDCAYENRGYANHISEDSFVTGYEVILKFYEENKWLSKEELRRNRVPNYFIKPEYDPNNPFGDLYSCSDMIGTNRGVYVIEGATDQQSVLENKRTAHFIDQAVHQSHWSFHRQLA